MVMGHWYCPISYFVIRKCSIFFIRWFILKFRQYVMVRLYGQQNQGLPRLSSALRSVFHATHFFLNLPCSLANQSMVVAHRKWRSKCSDVEPNRPLMVITHLDCSTGNSNNELQWVFSDNVADVYYLTFPYCHMYASKTLQWRHHGRDNVSNHQPRDCLLNRLRVFRHRSKKTYIKVPRHWPMCGEITGDRWISRTNGQ